MMVITSYDQHGQITGQMSYPDDNILATLPADARYILGVVPANHWIDAGVPRPLPANPSTDTLIYEFDYPNHRWIIDHALTNTAIRQHRAGLLALIDRVNPVWFSTLTAEQQQQLQVYRQALLDITDQPSYPQVTWPAKPAWF